LSRILITDDDSTTRDLLSLIIGQFLKYDFDIAENCSQAIKMTIINDYALSIINIHMNGVNENSLVKFLNELSPDTKIIAITNSDDQDFKKSIFKSGAVHVLNKPFSIKLDIVGQYA